MTQITEDIIEQVLSLFYIVGKVKDRAHSILAGHLHYDERAINGFIVALSEVCQNIIEHSKLARLRPLVSEGFARKPLSGRPDSSGLPAPLLAQGIKPRASTNGASPLEPPLQGSPPKRAGLTL